MYMIIIKVDCCGRPQTLCGLSVWTSSDAMRAKELKHIFTVKNRIRDILCYPSDICVLFKEFESYPCVNIYRNNLM